MDRAQNETNVYEPARPESMPDIGNRRAQIHLAGRVLHRIVEKRELTDDWIIRGIGETNLGSERALRASAAALLSDCFAKS